MVDIFHFSRMQQSSLSFTWNLIKISYPSFHAFSAFPNEQISLFRKVQEQKLQVVIEFLFCAARRDRLSTFCDIKADRRLKIYDFCYIFLLLNVIRLQTSGRLSIDSATSSCESIILNSLFKVIFSLTSVLGSFYGENVMFQVHKRDSSMMQVWHHPLSDISSGHFKCVSSQLISRPPTLSSQMC